MKLRIKGNSLPVRIGRSELDRLSRGETVEDAIHFGPAGDQRICYALHPSTDAVELRAEYSAGRITMLLPRDLLAQWNHQETVGISVTQDTGGGRELSILIEKDFACIKEPDEDAFPNPRHGV